MGDLQANDDGDFAGSRDNNLIPFPPLPAYPEHGFFPHTLIRDPDATDADWLQAVQELRDHYDTEGHGVEVADIAGTGLLPAEAERQGVRRIHLALAATRDVAAASVILEH